MDPIDLNIQLLQFLGLLIPGLIIAGQFLPSEGDEDPQTGMDAFGLRVYSSMGKEVVGPGTDDETDMPETENEYRIRKRSILFLGSLSGLVVSAIVLLCNAILYLSSGGIRSGVLYVSILLIIFSMILLVLVFASIVVNAIRYI